MIDWTAQHGRHFQEANVLVTGGAGFIGSHLCEALLQLGARVTVLDDLSGGDPAHIDWLHQKAPDRLTFVHGSILDRPAVERACQQACYVFHQAALGSVPESIRQPLRYTQVNVLGTQQLLDAASAAGVQRLVFASSSAIYGDSEQLPKTESMVPLPQSPYAATKAAGEALLRAAGASTRLDTVSLRYFNIFGQRQSATNAYAAVMAAFARALIQESTCPTIFGDGEQTRDFTHVTNAVHANLLAARQVEPLRGAAINIAGGRRITVNQLARQMAQLAGKPHLTPRYEPPRAGDVRHSQADLTQARSLLGYEPVVDLDTGLAATVDWYQQQMA